MTYKIAAASPLAAYAAWLMRLPPLPLQGMRSARYGGRDASRMPYVLFFAFPQGYRQQAVHPFETYMHPYVRKHYRHHAEFAALPVALAGYARHQTFPTAQAWIFGSTASRNMVDPVKPAR
ncbi:MAG: hypothetical protein EOO28_10225 [Comamonadaceae bacterium]|nr:MAG: hypothetical protein EOO28_10225 [Comamonadaceae bacterium]